MNSLYSHTKADLDKAFATLSESLFAKARDAECLECEPSPKILVVAGTQGSGKTYLLENKLLPSGRYENHVSLYLPSFRKHHPQYERMKDHGIRHVYEHTNKFVWDLGSRVLDHALENRYNIIMETALDSAKFADFPADAVKAGYQFEVHIIACQKEFSHWATLDRFVNSVASDVVERVLTLSAIEASQLNARAILDAFENACTQVPGSEITLYHRGIETGMESKPLCHSECTSPSELTPQAEYHGQPFTSLPRLNPYFEIRRNASANFPCSYLQYAQVVNAGMIDAQVREEMVKYNCKTMERAQALMPIVPSEVFRELSLYVMKYIYP